MIVKKNELFILSVIASLILLSCVACANQQSVNPQNRSPAFIDGRWEIEYLQKAKKIVAPAPEYLKADILQKNMNTVRLRLINTGKEPWQYGEQEYGEIQVQLDDVWYRIPSVGGSNFPIIISEGKILNPGETVENYFSYPSYYPDGHYRYIWNGVSAEFDITE